MRGTDAACSWRATHLGGSFVILMPACSTLTGNEGDGYEVNHSLIREDREAAGSVVDQNSCKSPAFLWSRGCLHKQRLRFLLPDCAVTTVMVSPESWIGAFSGQTLADALQVRHPADRQVAVLQRAWREIHREVHGTVAGALAPF